MNDTNYKKSRFNHEVALPGTDDTILYNFRTHRFARLNPLQKFFFDMAPFAEKPEGFLKMLCEKGMIVSGDEIESLKAEINATRENYRSLHLSINVNDKCNFACEYCLETDQLTKKEMSDATKDGIIHFVRYFVENNEIDSMTVIWFGGEPMLNPEIIEYISSAIIPLADEHNITYKSGIYTNGFTLTPDNVRLLERCRVNTVRISVDGIGPFNDKYRHLKNGHGTYDTIINNIKNTKTSITYRIRCNINKENYMAFEDLVKELKNIEKESGNRIACAAERMKVEEYVNKDLKEIEFSQAEYLSVYSRIKDLVVREEDLDIFPLHHKLKIPCSACAKHGFKVDVEGNISKCRWDPGNKMAHVIGNVKDFDGTFKNQEKIDFFLNFTVPERERCLKCKLLPVCMGRCPLNVTVPELYSCHRLLNDLDWTVLTLYSILKEASENKL